jgi:hypothetical protein
MDTHKTSLTLFCACPSERLVCLGTVEEARSTKGKVRFHAMKAYKSSGGVTPVIPFPWHWIRVNGQIHTPAALYFRQSGWVSGPRSGR